MSKPTIMIVEDKFIVAQDIATSLEKLGYEVCTTISSGEEVLEAVKELQPDIVLMDIRLKGQMDGIETATRLKSELDLPVIYLTAHSDTDTLARASQTEPYGYLIKPFDDRQLFTTLELALNKRRTVRAKRQESEREAVLNAQDSPQSRKRKEFSNIVGSSKKMRDLLESIKLVAITDVGVQIYGENGTGKELIADAIHKLSNRSSKAFIKLNCSAIPGTLLESALFGHSRGAFTGANKEQEGFIERAEGGTLFLDEVGDVSHEIQIKLLRLLQSREYHRVGETSARMADVRILTATNRDLKELVQQGKIREDFYYRINVFPVIVPPLRDRGGDVLEIAEYYRALFNKTFAKQVSKFSEDAKSCLCAYRWPGNVRELENSLKRAFVLVQGNTIERAHLPPEIAGALATPIQNETSSRQDIVGEENEVGEREKILDALQKTGGHKGKAAILLGYSRITLWKKLTKLGIENAPSAAEDSDSRLN